MKTLIECLFVILCAIAGSAWAHEKSPYPLPSNQVMVDKLIKMHIGSDLGKGIIFTPPQKWIACNCVRVFSQVFSNDHYNYLYIVNQDLAAFLLIMRIRREQEFDVEEGYASEVLLDGPEYNVEIIYPTHAVHSPDPKFTKMILTPEEIRKSFTLNGKIEDPAGEKR